jgi:catechol 2,3-dioxygenase-like lactoylglutathione lyase family enzyme
MINHLSLGATNLQRSSEFYENVFGHLGYRRTRANEKEVAFGPGDDQTLWLYPVETGEKVAAPRMHLAIDAPSRESIHACFDEAIRRGGRAVRPPGARPDIGPDYYGAIIDDPDGHRIEVVLITATMH